MTYETVRAVFCEPLLRMISRTPHTYTQMDLNSVNPQCLLRPLLHHLYRVSRARAVPRNPGCSARSRFRCWSQQLSQLDRRPVYVFRGPSWIALTNDQESCIESAVWPGLQVSNAKYQSPRACESCSEFVRLATIQGRRRYCQIYLLNSRCEHSASWSGKLGFEVVGVKTTSNVPLARASSHPTRIWSTQVTNLLRMVRCRLCAPVFAASTRPFNCPLLRTASNR